VKKDTSDNRKLLFAGAKDGIPIGLGYLAVGFSLGIVAAEAGMNAAEGFLASLLCNASAGQYAGYTLMAANATLLELIVMMLIINARYLLMSFALSQRVDPDLPVGHRLLMSNYITDEIFGISIAQGGSVKPQYMYGAAMVASPMWAAGNALGIIAGNILPLSVSSALSVALYGMLTSVIIPPAKKRPRRGSSDSDLLCGKLGGINASCNLGNLGRHQNYNPDAPACRRRRGIIPTRHRRRRHYRLRF